MLGGHREAKDGQRDEQAPEGGARCDTEGASMASNRLRGRTDPTPTVDVVDVIIDVP